MPNDNPLFDSQYVDGSSTPPNTWQDSHPMEEIEARSQTGAESANTLPGLNMKVEAQRYGEGKPYRIVIRGKISRD